MNNDMDHCKCINGGSLIPAPGLILLFMWPLHSFSHSELQPERVKKLSIKELMDIEVTIVSRCPKNWLSRHQLSHLY